MAAFQLFGTIDTYGFTVQSPEVGPFWAGIQLAGSWGQAAIAFVEEGAALPESYHKDGYAFVFYRVSQFPHVMDILRNESPVSFQYSVYENGSKNIMISNASSEPVGEGE